jgi:hypothetical protein
MKMQSGAAVRTLQTLLAIGSVVMALGAAFYAFSAVFQGTVPQPVEVYPPEATSKALMDTMNVSSSSTVVVQVSEMDGATAFVVALPAVVVAGLGSAMLALLAALLRDSDAGRPFTPHNVKRLQWVARLVLLAAVVGWWLGPALEAWAQSRLDSSVVSAHTNFAPFLLALGAYALVTIWKRGAELADFEENTV